MLLITYEISKKLYPDKPLYLEVRTWNIRAVKCYQKAGFRIDGQASNHNVSFDLDSFLCNLPKSLPPLAAVIHDN